MLNGVEYFHVVFTVPETIAAIAYQNKKVLYDMLFHASAETLRTIAADRWSGLVHAIFSPPSRRQQM